MGSPPPPVTPPGWHDDPDDSTSLRYWDGSAWTDDRAPKPPAPPSQTATVPTSGTRNRPDSMWGGKPAPTPGALGYELNGLVDVKLSTVPSVAVASTKANYYKVYASKFDGALSVKTYNDVDVATFDQGTYTADMTMGYKDVRKTPTWAIVLGVIGLFIFLIGIVFFFVKETRQVEARILTVTLTDGRSFSGPYVDEADYK